MRKLLQATLVSLTPAEIALIADYLEMTPENVVELYTLGGPEPILINEPNGCVFLDNGLCLIYDARPEVCRNFPHLSIGGRSLTSRLSSICTRAELCPIVYNVLERYKLVGFQAYVRCQIR
ncbi:MAG: YkgJ family cysteine cluster protein [Bryobacteraceae bacterium]